MRVFTELFKYPLDLYREGGVAFIGRVPAEVLLLVFAGLALLAWWMYRRVRGRTTPVSWRTLVALRLALMGVLLLLLAVPALRTLRSRQHVYTVVLVDTSRSMKIVDVKTDAGALMGRIDAARKALVDTGAGNKGLLAALRRSSKVVVYGFDEDVRRIVAVGQISAEGRFTDVSRACHDVDVELRGMPLAAAVLLTDGCRNAGGTLEDAAALLKARGVPLYIIGLGNPEPPRDYEVLRVVAPRRVRRNSEVEIQATLRHTGYAEPFEVAITRGSDVLMSRRVEPRGDSDVTSLRLAFTPDQQGSATYRVSLPTVADDSNPDNNGWDFALDIRDDRLPVLYVEGSPRLEYRFLRRALFRDPDFRVVGLLRLGDDRYYVQGADESEKYIEKGFPTTADQLFAFEAVILGDIEASYFTAEQMSLLDTFVRKRGGGLLMLGGVNSFGLGGYGGTPVGQLLPVRVTKNDGAYSDDTFKARLLRGIGLHPLVRLSLDPGENQTLWDQAPPLIGLTPVDGLQPGALTLLARAADDRPVLAVQNAGAGRVGAFMSGGSWYWRVSTPSSVEFHERFWKQMMRWLAVGAKERLTLETDSDIGVPGRPLYLRATVLGKDMQPLNDATVTATITDPLGNRQDLTMDWILSEEGVYQARYVPLEEGNVHVSVKVEGWDMDPVETELWVSEPLVESADAGLRVDRLKQMADITGGAYFSYDQADEVADEVARAVGVARGMGLSPEDREIWDMPVLFALAFALMMAELVLRRRSGLA